MSKKRKLRVGDWVEIQSREEILKTLDTKGQVEGMPFMPEMFAFCGKRFPIRKRAHKTCDTVFPVRGRRLSGAVHIETRCDGSAHGGCQARCMFFWKDAWFEPAAGPEKTPLDTGGGSDLAPAKPTGTGCSEQGVWANTSRSEAGETLYSCQATQLPYA